MSNVRELSQVDKLYVFMREQGVNLDTSILIMYATMLDLPHLPRMTDDREHRRMQQRVGGVVSRINKKLNGMRIVPGERKRTYRLIKTK